jgi:hypothetical protein
MSFIRILPSSLKVEMEYGILNRGLEIHLVNTTILSPPPEGLPVVIKHHPE